MDEEKRLRQLEDLKTRMAEERPIPWDSLPDIPLYMDQVVSYLSRQLITFGEGDSLTSAMINNYIKDGLVPRANGKKYEREHLAYLTVVAAAKQVLSVRDMGVLLAAAGRPIQAKDGYEGFCAELDRALNRALQDIEEAHDPEDLPALAMSLALRSYADALACRRLVELLRPDEGEQRKKKEKRPSDAGR